MSVASSGDSISTEQNNSFSTNFWSYEGSRPTGDKKDVIKKRTKKKQHIEHAKHVLEKIQTEAFVKFQAQYQEVKTKYCKVEENFQSLRTVRNLERQCPGGMEPI